MQWGHASPFQGVGAVTLGRLDGRFEIVGNLELVQENIGTVSESKTPKTNTTRHARRRCAVTPMVCC